MILNELRIYLFQSDSPISSQIEFECQHILDAIAISQLQLSKSEMTSLAALFKNKSDLKISELLNLTPDLIKSQYPVGEFSRPYALWKLFYQTCAFHILHCEEMSKNDEIYIELPINKRASIGMPISSLILSARSQNALDKAGITSSMQLTNLTREELLEIPNLGLTSFYEIESKLTEFGLTLKEKENLDLSIGNVKEISIENLGLTVRSYNALRRASVNDIGGLLRLSESEIFEIRNIGEKSALEILETQSKFADVAAKTEKSSLAIDEKEMLTKIAEQVKAEFNLVKSELQNYLTYNISKNSFPGSETQLLDFFEKSFESFPNSLETMFHQIENSVSEIVSQNQTSEQIVEFANLIDALYLYKYEKSNFDASNSITVAVENYSKLYETDGLYLLNFDSTTYFLCKTGIYLHKFGRYENLINQISKDLILDSQIWDFLRDLEDFISEYGTFPNFTGLMIASFSPYSPNQITAQRLLKELLNNNNPEYQDRDFQIIAERIEGKTLGAIGEAHSLTRERIRQIIMVINPRLEKTIETLKNIITNKFETDLHLRIDKLFQNHGALYKDELAEFLEMTEEEAIAILPAKYKRFVFEIQGDRSLAPKWEKEHALKILQKAGTYFFPLKTADYEHLLEIGELEGPSVAWYTSKFESWSNACFLAGVESGPAIRTEYSRIWSDEELISFVVRYLLEPDSKGSLNDYRSWREKQVDLVPSADLIRVKFGSWSMVARLALQQIREMFSTRKIL